MWECVGAALVNPHGDGGGVCAVQLLSLTQEHAGHDPVCRQSALTLTSDQYDRTPPITAQGQS